MFFFLCGVKELELAISASRFRSHLVGRLIAFQFREGSRWKKGVLASYAFVPNYISYHGEISSINQDLSTQLHHCHPYHHPPYS